MKDYEEEFIRFAIENGVIEFGEFILKSGRVSPWFFNAGRFNTGQSLARLGDYYARAIVDSGLAFDTLFGPAYKGIPLVASTAIALAKSYDRDVPYVFNRKEVKGHGEGGQLVGADLKGRILIVDDVITAGTAIRETMSIIDQSPGTAVGVLIAVDREERGTGAVSAIQEVERTYGIKVVSVVGFTEVIDYLEVHPISKAQFDRMTQYRDKYGVSSE